jgi:glycosyltransferase involved in cell wall biosynthesis
VVLGDTPEDMRPDHLDECRALVRDLGVSDAVHFLGYRADVRPYASEFDVAVVPSVYEDPLPRVVLESMALGKPVVAFAMGGIPEMVADGATGFLVSGAPPDLEGLARAFVRYFRDASLRREHGMAARRRVENEFNARHHAAAIQGELLRVGRGDG